MDQDEHRLYHREEERFENTAKNTMGDDAPAERTNGQLTPQERTLLEINAVVWNGFGALPKQYPTDINDMRVHIDAINNIILARAASRANPELIRRHG